MATNINQKAYLQKYLSGPSGEKKKKKKKSVKGAGLKIIDDDIDLSKLRPLDGDELDILDQGEDAPQIAGIIDERPEEVKKAEQFSISSKWKVINQDDGFNSKLEISEIKSDIKQVEKENELIFGKMYSDSEDEQKNNSDASPPRKPTNDNQAKSKPSKKHDSDSDFSPPRKTDRSPRSSKKERARKPSRWGDFGPETVSTDHSPKRGDRNPSPHRKSRKDTSKRRSPSSDQSPPRKSRNNDSDASPPRKSRKNNDSDESPPRKSKKNHDSRRNDDSPPRKSKKNYDSDMSPPRKSKSDGRRPEPFSPSKKRRHSPEKQNYKDRNDKHNSRQDRSKKYKHSSDSDMSPPRKNKRQKSISPSRKQRSDHKRKYNSDSDQSPPRRERNNDRRGRNDSPPPSNKKMAKTLTGMTAGLQDAKQLRKESEKFREKEEEVFKKMSDEVSGRNAQVVSRKSKRETSEDRQKQKEKAERQKVLDEKYKKWSKGIKQIQDQESRVAEFLHEASKPLARHKDDRDLEDNLKQIERAGDPMLKYIRERKRERGELGPEKPMYKGNFPINRFGIRPGYRWDGVDRSNGYEKKYFDQQSKRKAQEEEAYKWSIEDL
ncbi:BUD13 homolog [Trichoplusia ni]|uniref:BUD13 homolog n=1 Tax=Trichoplusia ni TaxID=7111 RepID=A0A7E5WS50_TRINI|nr:BUD13 homolog [Trichoplusia ni]